LRLVEIAKSQARLIEAIARFDKTYSNDYPFGARAATLHQIKDAHSRYEGFGKTGEFTLSTKKKGWIVFLQVTVDQLEKALSEVKTLKGMVPICSFCKKIRNDKGYWDQVEVYVRNHAEADFSHSICPDCLKQHDPDLRLTPLKKTDAPVNSTGPENDG
jgi:hypothetical protein